MKYSKMGKLLVFILILIHQLSCHRTKYLKKNLEMPRIADIKNEYLTQNTAKYIMGENLSRTDLEVNPNRYVILNGYDEANDPEMKRGTVYDKDNKAYYPYSTQKEVTSLQSNQVAENKNSDNIYVHDKDPYYTPSGNFKPVNNLSYEKSSVSKENWDSSRQYTESNKNQSRQSNENKSDSFGAPSNSKNINMQKKFYDTSSERTMIKPEIVSSLRKMKEDILYPNSPGKLENVSAEKTEQISISDKDSDSKYYYYPKISDAAPKNVNSDMENKSDSVISSSSNKIIESLSPSLNQTPESDVSSKSNKTSETKLNKNASQNNSNYVEADEKEKIVAEAEVVGVTLGSKYVSEKTQYSKKPVEADSAQKRIVEADVNNNGFNPGKYIKKVIPQIIETDKKNTEINNINEQTNKNNNNNNQVVSNRNEVITGNNIEKTKESKNEPVQASISKKDEKSVEIKKEQVQIPDLQKSNEAKKEEIQISDTKKNEKKVEIKKEQTQPPVLKMADAVKNDAIIVASQTDDKPLEIKKNEKPLEIKKDEKSPEINKEQAKSLTVKTVETRNKAVTLSQNDEKNKEDQSQIALSQKEIKTKNDEIAAANQKKEEKTVEIKKEQANISLPIPQNILDPNKDQNQIRGSKRAGEIKSDSVQAAESKKDEKTLRSKEQIMVLNKVEVKNDEVLIADPKKNKKSIEIKKESNQLIIPQNSEKKNESSQEAPKKDENSVVIKTDKVQPLNFKENKLNENNQGFDNKVAVLKKSDKKEVIQNMQVNNANMNDVNEAVAVQKLNTESVKEEITSNKIDKKVEKNVNDFIKDEINKTDDSKNKVSKQKTGENVDKSISINEDAKATGEINTNLKKKDNVLSKDISKVKIESNQVKSKIEAEDTETKVNNKILNKISVINQEIKPITVAEKTILPNQIQNIKVENKDEKPKNEVKSLTSSSQDKKTITQSENEKNLRKNNEINDSEDNYRANSNSEDVPLKKLHTQGLKVERVRIIPMRQILDKESEASNITEVSH